MAVQGERELRQLARRLLPDTRAAFTLYVRVHEACEMTRIVADAEIMALKGLPASHRALLTNVKYLASKTRGVETSSSLARKLRTLVRQIARSTAQRTKSSRGSR